MATPLEIKNVTLMRNPRQVTLAREDMVRTTATLDEAFLLEEALRFYNFGIEPKSGAKYQANHFVRKTFEPIDEVTAASAVRELGALYSDRAYALLERLDRNDEFRKALSDQRKTDYVDALLRD